MVNGRNCRLAVAILLSVGVGACGDASKRQSTTTASQASDWAARYTPADSAQPGTSGVKPRPIQDIDGDREDANAVKVIPGSPYDDDDAIIHYGNPAGAADRRAISILAGRYLAAVAADDGAGACGLMHSTLTEAIVEDSNVPIGKQNACGGILTRLFKAAHKHNTLLTHKLHVVQVQVRGRKGLALMGRHAIVENGLRVKRELGAWKISQINGTGMP